MMPVNRCMAILLSLFILAVFPWPQRAHAITMEFIGFDAAMSYTVDRATGNETLSLLAESSLYGRGGFAGGLFQIQGSPGMDDGIWLTDPSKPPPDDQTPVISFALNPDGTIQGPDPVPFRLFLARPPPDDDMPSTLVGELDFSGVTGYTGSLHLSGLKVLAVDSAGSPTGETYDVAPFTIQPAPEPPSLLLVISGLAGLIGAGRRLRNHGHV